MNTLVPTVKRVIEHLKTIHFCDAPEDNHGPWLRESAVAPEGKNAEFIKLVRFLVVLPEANLLIDRDCNFDKRLLKGFSIFPNSKNHKHPCDHCL